MHSRTLTDLQHEVLEVNVTNHWFDSDRSFEDGIALLHSEVSEALEAYRDHGLDDMTPNEPWSTQTPQPKPEGVGSELADVLVRWLDETHRQQIDVSSFHSFLPAGIGKYPNFASFGAAVAELHKQITFWHIHFHHDESLEALNIYTLLEAIAEFYQFDLMYEFERKLAFNRTRGPRHGGKLL